MRWHGTDADGSGTMKTEICILDLPTGRVDTVFRTDRLIEAPNWGPDDTLIVNGDGRLYRLPLNDPGLLPIDTGILDRLNNDHGPSPDGKLLAFSDKTETGMACIYVMPADGGPPLPGDAEDTVVFPRMVPGRRAPCLYGETRRGLRGLHLRLGWVGRKATVPRLRPLRRAGLFP